MLSEEREPGLGQEGPVGASGIMQQPYFCQLFEQLGTSPGGRSHEIRSFFMWFQLTRAIQDFKSALPKDGPACLCLHLSQLLSGPLPES